MPKKEEKDVKSIDLSSSLDKNKSLQIIRHYIDEFNKRHNTDILELSIKYKLNVNDVLNLLSEKEENVKKKLLGLATRDIEQTYNINSEQLLNSLITGVGAILTIPVSIFKNTELSAFETVCRYLKDEAKLSYHYIAVALDRDDRTIWSTYNNSLKKRKESLVVLASEYSIPISIFKTKLTILENIVVYLKDHYNLNYAKIAELLNRDQRNIWTVYNRAKKR